MTEREGTPTALIVRRGLGFIAAFGLTLVLALNGGGYDLVIRHEVGLVIWAVIAVGIAAGVLPRARLNNQAWLAFGGFAALAALTLLAHSWTDSDERTTAELARVLQYAGVVALALLALNRNSWQGAAFGFGAAALLVVVLAVCSRLFPDLATDQYATIGLDRLSYPLDYWNAVACWGAMAVAVGLVWSAHAPATALRSLSLALVPVASLAVYLTYSRFGVAAVAIAALSAFALGRNRWTTALNGLAAAAGSALAIVVVRGQDEIARATGDAGAGAVLAALVAAGVGCAIVAAVTSEGGADELRMRRSTSRMAVGAAAIGTALMLVALNGPVERAWDEFREQPGITSAADPAERLTSFGGSRYEVWSTALDAFKSDPERGIGPGTFEFYWAGEGAAAEFVRDAHSLYFEQLAELGILGLAALLAALAGLLLGGGRARARWSRDRDMTAGAALISVLVVFLAYAAIDWVWEIAAIGTLALGAGAVATAGGLDRARPSLGLGLRSALAAGALFAAAVQIPGLVATERIRAGEHALAQGDPAEAKALADEAVDAEGWAALPYATRAAAEQASGNQPQARADALEAIEREPTNWRHQLLLARIDAALGDRAAVNRALAEARRLAPHSPFLVAGSAYLLSVEQQLAASRPGAGP